jgi:hypothetical protein
MFNDNIFDREQSTSAELYIFSFSDGSNLYFTSFERDILTSETYDGYAYTHIPIQRSEFENDDTLASNKMQITAPVLNTFANNLIFGGQINVSIIKMFLADKTHQSIFNGLILSIEKNVGEAIAQCASKMYYLEKDLPRVFFQAQCNNTLFDAKCTMLKSNYQYTVSATVSQNGYKLTINDSDYNGILSDFPFRHYFNFPDGSTVKGLWTLGQATYNGEIRFITNHLVKVIYLHYPFTGIVSGVISLVLIAGCDKTGLYCSTVFGTTIPAAKIDNGNIFNFTGMPYMPAADPTIMAVGT